MKRQLYLQRVDTTPDRIAIVYRLEVVDTDHNRVLTDYLDITYPNDNEPFVYVNKSRQDMKDTFIRKFDQLERNILVIGSEVDTSFLDF